jgi:hypothetical protein
MVLQEIERFSYATALDLNMAYYTIRLDPDASKICTIIFPWGKYSYKRLPMGIAGSPDIFQGKMSELMKTLEYVRAYLDDRGSNGKNVFLMAPTPPLSVSICSTRCQYDILKVWLKKNDHFFTCGAAKAHIICVLVAKLVTALFPLGTDPVLVLPRL